MLNREDKVVGYLRRGGFGYTINQSLGMGYVDLKDKPKGIHRTGDGSLGLYFWSRKFIFARCIKRDSCCCCCCDFNAPFSKYLFIDSIKWKIIMWHQIFYPILQLLGKKNFPDKSCPVSGFAPEWPFFVISNIRPL